MAFTADALEVLLDVRNYREFMSKMGSAAGAVKGVGAASKESAAASNLDAAAKKKQAAATDLVKRSMKSVALIGIATAVASAKMAIDFQKQTTLIQTQAGDTAKNVQMYRDRILNMVNDPLITGTPIELAKAMYTISSIGIKGAAGMKFLEEAARGAAISGEKAETVAHAMGAIWMAHIKGGKDADKIMATLNATVGAGAMTMGDLTHAMGTGILGTANLFHLSLIDVNSALALMTDEGTSATSAATQLRTALHFLTNPSEKAAKALASIGLDGRMLGTDLRTKGLKATLQHIKDNTQGMSDGDITQLFGNIFPGGRGAILLSLMNQLDRLQMKHDEITKNATTGKLRAAEMTASETDANKLKNAWAKLEAQMIRLGDQVRQGLTPALVALLQVLSTILAVVIWVGHGLGILHGWYEKLPGPMKTVVQFLLIFAGSLGAVWAMQKAFMAIRLALFLVRGGIISTTVALMTNPITATLVVVLAVITMIILHWKWFKQALTDTFHWLRAHPFAILLFGPLAPLVGLLVLVASHWDDVKKVAVYVAGKVSDAWEATFGRIERWYKTLKRWYSEIKDHPAATAGKVINKGGNKLVHIAEKTPAGWLAKQVYNVFHHATGVEGFNSGMAGGAISMVNDNFNGEKVWLPNGSSVQPSPASSMRHPRAHTPNPTPIEANDRPIELDVYLDGKQITAVVTKRLADKKARMGRGTTNAS